MATLFFALSIATQLIVHGFEQVVALVVPTTCLMKYTDQELPQMNKSVSHVSIRSTRGVYGPKKDIKSLWTHKSTFKVDDLTETTHRLIDHRCI